RPRSATAAIMTMDFDPFIQRKRERFEQLEREIADPKLFDNRKSTGEIMREHAGIKTVLAKWEELENARKQLDDNRELATSRDVEIAAMADDEIPDLEKRVAELEREMQIALLPPDENENRDAIVEIRAGTGGSEAAIFAADLYRMYHRYAESAGLKTEDLESSPSELGGLKEVIFRLSGEAGFRILRYTCGVHRRAPVTREGIERAPPLTNRHWPTRRKNSHLQFPTKPRDRSPHCLDALQFGSGHGGRSGRIDQRAASCRCG